MAFICSCRLSVRAVRSASSDFAELRQHHLFEMIEIVARDRFARRDRHFVAVGHRQNAAAHGAEPLALVGAVPANDRYRQRRQEIGMALENAEAAALVLGAHRDDIRIVDDDGRGSCNQQSHDGLASRFAAFSLSRASSIVPTM